MPKQNSRSTSKKAKEAEEKPSKPKKIHARKRFELSEEQKLLSDIPHLLSIGQSIPEILRSKPGLSKHHALRILQESFAQKIVSVSPTTPDDAKTGLGHIFPDVQFAVVPGSPQYFDDRATTQVLQWLTELCSRRPQSADDSTRSGAEDRPVIAWGGGMAIHDIATALRRVIELPANRNIKQWLNRNHGKLVFTNATAGGQPSNPKYEASYLAIVCAEATDQDVATYSLSRDSFHDELQIIDNAVRNTLVVISGVGDQETAY